MTPWTLEARRDDAVKSSRARADHDSMRFMPRMHRSPRSQIQATLESPTGARRLADLAEVLRPYSVASPESAALDTLAAMTQAELFDEARRFGIIGFRGMSRGDLIRALLDAGAAARGGAVTELPKPA
jgi:hypothetical protein